MKLCKVWGADVAKESFLVSVPGKRRSRRKEGGGEERLPSPSQEQ